MMPWSPWYDATQNWAEVGVTHGAQLMKHVYENYDEAKAKGQRLKTYIAENFSREVIGKRLINEIESTGD